MVEKGGTDLHVTTNSPPIIRVDGVLLPLNHPALTAVDTKKLAYSILTDAQKHRFEENLELDLSFGIKGLARFRANIFVQRGAVAGAFRRIPYEILGFRELGLPPVVETLCDKPARPGAGDRPDRLRQVDHAGGDDRQGQPREAAPHRHHRGPGRVPAHPQEGDGQPARAALRHPVLPERPALGAARGPRRGADRRDARPGDHRVGAADRRDRPPDLRHPAHQLGPPDHQPHHRRLPGAPAVPDPCPAQLRARGHHLSVAAAAGLRQGPRSGDRDPDPQLGDPQPDPRGQDPPDLLDDADRPGQARDADLQPVAGHPVPPADDHAADRAVLQLATPTSCRT